MASKGKDDTELCQNKADMSRCAKCDFLEATCPFLSITMVRDGECLRQWLQSKAVNQEKVRWCTMVFLLELTVQREKDFFKE